MCLSSVWAVRISSPRLSNAGCISLAVKKANISFSATGPVMFHRLLGSLARDYSPRMPLPIIRHLSVILHIPVGTTLTCGSLNRAEGRKGALLCQIELSLQGKAEPDFVPKAHGECCQLSPDLLPRLFRKQMKEWWAGSGPLYFRTFLVLSLELGGAGRLSV